MQGNALLSILGAIGGEAAGLGLGALTTKIFGELTEPVGTLIFLGVIPFASSAGASWGYNFGAEMIPPPTAAVATWPGRFIP
ncbi:MAG: hypothetical protein A2Z21_06455 [Candidatus Fraserbacteria bacterium RBG_16_55_9]|uniref:Uncharacterized protein n=1 Tax=Fraserbacteria sp. (strain RBG_16_55_9) TaxID=1817864 RepID=A0A1F5UX69_FRAXR|nr:MAG: hypothetical protein A2Z21_06455 [Candidatus Fraserbacteria bacterium RBG_16_55_9]